MISLGTSNTLLNCLTAQSADATDANATSTSAGASAAVKTRLAATADAALQKAANSGRALLAGHALEKQQASLAADLRSALSKAGVKLSGPVEFSVGSDGTVATKAGAADKAAVTAFLKTDTAKPSFATRIATQARDALKLSATVRQSAAVSQAARYGGKSGGVMTLYTSLMQQSSSGTAVFNVAPGGSSLTYPGSLATSA